jgi:hypothetical protein
VAKQIDPAVVALVKKDWQDAPYREKSETIRKWADRLGVSYQTLYKGMGAGRKRKGERKVAGIEEAARIVAQIKARPPEHKGQIVTVDAIELAIKNGVIEQSFADIHPATFDRVIRDLGVQPQRRRVSRFQAEYPNKLHHVDGSTSSCFYVWKQMPDGEYIYRIHKGLKDYKNKPVPIRLRPLIYGVADDNSGVHCARYVAALGENALDNIDFLFWAWDRIGVCEFWKGDKGPMNRCEDANQFLRIWDVKPDPSTPLNKDAHGKIERPWRTMWQRFELPFYAESEWQKFEITQSELNRRFLNYQEEYNSWPHRYERNLTRKQVWERINLRGGVVRLPPNALEIFTRRIERTVGQDGCFRLNNEIFEVKGLHDAKVLVYQGVYQDKMVVVDQKTGERYEVENFKPNGFQEFTAQKETEYQKTVKEAVKLTGLSNTLYVEEKAAPAKVTKMPTRVKEVRQAENVLDVDTYPSVDAALREFQALCGFILDQDMRAEVKALIEAEGLSRRFVQELALDLQMEQAQAL